MDRSLSDAGTQVGDYSVAGTTAESTSVHMTTTSDPVPEVCTGHPISDEPYRSEQDL